MLFYNLVAIILGLIIIFYAIKLIINKDKIKGICFIIIAILYIGLGIFGFFIKKDIDYIIVISLIVLCIVTLVLFSLLFKNNNKNMVK